MFECNPEPWERISDAFEELKPKILSLCYPLMPERPQAGQFYRMYPKGCVSGNGTAYHGNVRIGKKPNKLLIYFNGGGFSFDEYTVSRPWNAFTGHIKDTYYSNDGEWFGDYFLRNGMSAQREDNPFLSWSAIQLLYCNGDFFCGNGEFPYTAQDGSARVMPYHGYRNAMAVIDMAKQYLPEPECILIAGSSAGGFGVSLLADDVMAKFPNCRNIACCVDSAMLLSNRWRNIAKEVWHSPEHIAKRLTGNNIVLDSLAALHRERGARVKILFISSVRDALLIVAQNALDGKGQISGEADGRQYQQQLKQMCGDLVSAIPDVGCYVFTAPMDAPGFDESLTLHCALNNSYLFERNEDGRSVCDWLLRAMEGKPERVGLELLNEAL